MKKYLYLLILISGFANAQLTINQPTELQSGLEGKIYLSPLNNLNFN